jgi:hypothetical protein
MIPTSLRRLPPVSRTVPPIAPMSPGRSRPPPRIPVPWSRVRWSSPRTIGLEPSPLKRVPKSVVSSCGDAAEYVPASCPRPGVGSNGSQPWPSNQTSTQACASWSVTVQRRFDASYEPLVKPTATRAGIPSDRSMSVIAPAKYWQ